MPTVLSATGGVPGSLSGSFYLSPVSESSLWNLTIILFSGHHLYPICTAISRFPCFSTILLFSNIFHLEFTLPYHSILSSYPPLHSQHTSCLSPNFGSLTARFVPRNCSSFLLVPLLPHLPPHFLPLSVFLLSSPSFPSSFYRHNRKLTPSSNPRHRSPNNLVRPRRRPIQEKPSRSLRNGRCRLRPRRSIRSRTLFRRLSTVHDLLEWEWVCGD